MWRYYSIGWLQYAPGTQRSPLFWEGLTFKNRGRIGVEGVYLGFGPPPSNSGKWRFSYGIPKPKDVVILVVTIASWGATPNLPGSSRYLTFLPFGRFLLVNFGTNFTYKRKIQVKIVTPQFDFYFWRCNPLPKQGSPLGSRYISTVSKRFVFPLRFCGFVFQVEKRMAKDGSGQGTKNLGIRFFTKETDPVWRTYFSNGLVQSPLLRKTLFIWRNMLLCSHFFPKKKHGFFVFEPRTLGSILGFSGCWLDG